MPNRIIRDVGLTSLKLGALSDFGERFYWRVYQAVDDYGRYHADPRILLGKCFALVQDATLERIEAARDENARLNLLVIYQDKNGEILLQFTKFEQRKRCRASRFQAPDDGHMTVMRQSDDRLDRGSRHEDRGAREEAGIAPPLRLVHPADPGTSPPCTPAPEEPPCRECMTALSLLNELTCRTYDAAGRGMDRLHACHSRHGLEPVLAVIRDKVQEWGADAKMHRHLNPQTLFDSTRFDGYRNALLGPVGKTAPPTKCPRCRVATVQPGRDICWPCANPQVPVEVPKRPPEANA